MLPWWGWVLLWAVILVGGGLLVGLRARRTWRSAKALTTELGRAGALVSELEAAAERHRDEEPPAPPEPAVTQDPHRILEEHRRRKAEDAADRAARRAARMPPWVGNVH